MPPARTHGCVRAHTHTDRWTAGRAKKKRGTDALPRSASYSEAEMEWGPSLPPPSPPRTAPSLSRDTAHLPTGSTAGKR
jgi:hypothetical protein